MKVVVRAEKWSRNDTVLLRTGDNLLPNATEGVGTLGHARLPGELVRSGHARRVEGEDVLDVVAGLGRVLLRHHVEVLGVQSKARRGWRRHAKDPEGA